MHLPFSRVTKSIILPNIEQRSQEYRLISRFPRISARVTTCPKQVVGQNGERQHSS